jgi:predicted N-acetyltransferase YhbS
MRLVELDRLSEPYWEDLIAGESEPFGGVGESLVWRDKTRNIGVREDDGRLVAAAGAVLADVKVEQEPPFQVVGLGGLIVTRSARRRGLAHLLSARLLEIASEFEVQRAMLFCLAQLMPRYAASSASSRSTRRCGPTSPKDQSRCRCRRCGRRLAMTPAGLLEE